MSKLTNRELEGSITARHSGLKGILSAMCKDENECLQHKPKEIDIEEWQYLISYLGSEKLKTISKRDAEDKSKQQALETQQEPANPELWLLTHCPKGQWIDETSKCIYEEFSCRINEMEVAENRALPVDEQDEIFQSIVGSRSGHVYEQEYMARPSTSMERLRAKLDALTRVSAETQRRNNELKAQVQELQRQLAAERAGRLKQIEVERAECDRQMEVIQQSMKEEFMKLLANFHSQPQ
ncbi:myosin heavy chain, cardiac muscle isoform-like [Quercus lobata]|uniref:myosin heavy chain, cardiac muscle isoform-like n=1 Tax=Quercus lobata TaxID=97700 RepID=UPI0012453EF1|nr:myosin heavy chain, cardiac muscle isoform-like [Quercus lobata]